MSCPSTTPRKRQVRFSARHDIILLQEVIAQNPFASKEPGLSFLQEACKPILSFKDPVQ